MCNKEMLQTISECVVLVIELTKCTLPINCRVGIVQLLQILQQLTSSLTIKQPVVQILIINCAKGSCIDELVHFPLVELADVVSSVLSQRVPENRN